MREKLSLDDQEKRANVLLKIAEIKNKRQESQIQKERWFFEKSKSDSDVDKVRAIQNLMNSVVYDEEKTIIASEKMWKNAFTPAEIELLKAKALEIIKHF